MRRFNTIIESANPPGRNQLWIDHKKLRYFTENRWELLGGGEINPPEISDHDTWIIEGVDTGKPSRGEKGQTGEAGPTPLFRTTDTAVEYSYDGIEWEELVPLTDFQIHNNPDEEDITVTDDKLKFKDKNYSPADFSGLGRVYLRKNLVEGKNILTQDMISSSNTIYHIQYDYDLNGASITIPDNCILDFDGGTIVNGTINGTVLNDFLKPEWFGAKADGVTDDTNAAKMCLNLNVPTIQFTHGTYIINELLINKSNVQIEKTAIIKANRVCNYIFGLDYIDSSGQIPKAGISGSGKIDCNHLSNYGIIINRGLRTYIRGLFIKNPIVACVRKGTINTGDPTYGMCEISNLYLLNEKNGGIINANSVGIEIAGYDNRISHIECQDFKYTIKELGGGNVYDDIHGWLYTDGISMFADSSLFYIDTANWIFINNSVSDTIRRFIQTSSSKSCGANITNCSLFHNGNILDEQTLTTNPSIIFDKKGGDIINVVNQYINTLYNVAWTVIPNGKTNYADSVSLFKEQKRGLYADKTAAIAGNYYFALDSHKPIWLDTNGWVEADGMDIRATRIGDTLSRPASSYIYPSFTYFDTTINRPVWWTGSEWVEASSGSTGATGNSTRIMYAKTSSPSVTPVVISDNINPGSIWGTAIPSRTNTEAIWGIQASVTADNQLASPWEGPYLMTGINGEDGKDGADGTDGKDGKDAVTPNWYTYVFKLSDDKPSGPTSNDPNNPGNGWLDYPNANGNWWQCIGTVNGVTGKVTEWSEVIPLNGRDGQDGQDGQDGTAQDGRYTEFRFAKTTGSTPSLNKTLRDPSGWTVDFPTISEGEILWMIKAVINPDDTLYTNWDGPIRISGERGPQGNTGPAGKDGATGSQGVAGIPGVDIEWRFSLGTETSYDATYNSTVKATRDPSSYGWLLTQPDITGDKPYIWLIQARIIHAVNTDEGHLDNNGWQTPIRLNGINGLDGANGPAGKKGQLIYPAGVYGNTVSYTTDEYKAPYVLDPSDGNFYVLNSIMTWVGTQQNNKTPSQSYQEDGGKYWLKFEAFEAIYAKIGVIANGLIGSAVFNGNYMFSQQGTDTSGNPSSNYESFTGGEDSPFKPNLLIDFNTGDITYKGVSQVLSYQMTDNETLTITNKFPYNKIITAKNCTLKFALNDSYIPRTIEVEGGAIYNYATTGMFVNGGNLDKTLSYVELGTSTITYPAGEYYINNYSIPRVINNTMNGFLGQFSMVANNIVGVMSASTIFGQQNVGQLIWSQQGTGGTFTLDDDERRKIYPYDLTFSIPRLSATGLDYVGGKWWSVNAQLIVTNNTSGDKKIVSLVVQYPSDITGLSGSNSVSFTGLMLQ